MPLDATNYNQPSRTPNWDRIIISRGGHSHSGPSGGVCAMELLALLQLDPFFSDRPKNVCEALAEAVRYANDRLPPEDRQQLKKLIPYLRDTRSDTHELARRKILDQMRYGFEGHHRTYIFDTLWRAILAGPYRPFMDAELEERATAILNTIPDLSQEVYMSKVQEHAQELVDALCLPPHSVVTFNHNNDTLSVTVDPNWDGDVAPSAQHQPIVSVVKPKQGYPALSA